jgi:hypothetical protein
MFLSVVETGSGGSPSLYRMISVGPVSGSEVRSDVSIHFCPVQRL